MQKNDWYQNKTSLKARRQSLRSEPTKAEYVLWQELRREKLGYKFRRQFSIANFIVDFFCYELKLIIEVDGSVHEGREEYDKVRQTFLENQGYTVIRYRNDQVLFERENVFLDIVKHCQQANPSPRDPTLTLPS